MSKVYVMGSLRNPKVIEAANAIEKAGHEVYANWHSPGPDTDNFWREHALARGRNYYDELQGPHVSMVFENDRKWLDWCDTGLLLLPCGKSAYCELGYLRGKGTHTVALLDDLNPERWDIMLRFADKICKNMEDAISAIY